MELEGEIPTYSPGHPKVSATHTPHVDDEGYEFPLEGFLFVGRIPYLTLPETSGPMFSPGYTTLAYLVSSTPSASYLYQKPIWSSNSMPTSGLFILNVTSQTSLQNFVMLVPVQTTIPHNVYHHFNQPFQYNGLQVRFQLVFLPLH